MLRWAHEKEEGKGRMAEGGMEEAKGKRRKERKGGKKEGREREKGRETFECQIGGNLFFLPVLLRYNGHADCIHLRLQHDDLIHAHHEMIIL